MREKNESKKTYRQLAEIFEKWFINKEKEIQNCKNLDRPPKTLLEKLKITEDEYYQIYIEPYKKLSKEDLKITFRVLAPELVENFIDEDINPDCELNVVYDLSFARKQNALEWLIFQVENLGFFPLSKKLDDKMNRPYKQCFYCGKPDSYKKGNVEIEFNGKEVYCHKLKCQKSSNPEKHDNCCYAKWTRRRKTLESALKRADELYQDIEEYEQFRLDALQEDLLLGKLENIFIEFCQKQYEENLKIDYTIQTEDIKALCLTDYSL
jgi:ribosomal protein L24E